MGKGPAYFKIEYFSKSEKYACLGLSSNSRETFGLTFLVGDPDLDMSILEEEAKVGREVMAEPLSRDWRVEDYSRAEWFVESDNLRKGFSPSEKALVRFYHARESLFTKA